MVVVQSTVTGCPVGTEPAEGTRVQDGVLSIFGLAFQRTNLVEYAGIEVVQLIGVFTPST